MTVSDARARLERLKGERDRVKADLSRAKGDLERARADLASAERAREIIQNVAAQTQAALEFRVGELVSLAMDAVFPEPYQARLRFEARRGRTTAAVLFVDGDGNEFDPMAATGGGAVDVAAFALRIGLWSLRQPRSRATIVLDEPFRFLSTDLQPRASAMLKEVSERLGLQFIIVTHEEELLEAADRVFRVGIRDGKSKMKVEGAQDER